MYKFMILFQTPSHERIFENSYNNFLGLVEKMPGIQRRQVVNVLGSPLGETVFYRILEVYFDSQEAMEEALRSPAGQAAGGGLRRFSSSTYELIFTEVFEEAGGETPEPPVEAAPASASPAEDETPDTAEETAGAEIPAAEVEEAPSDSTADDPQVED